MELTFLFLRITERGIFSLPDGHMNEHLGVLLRVSLPFRKEREKMNRFYLFLFRITRIPSPTGRPWRRGIHSVGGWLGGSLPFLCLGGFTSSVSNRAT